MLLARKGDRMQDLIKRYGGALTFAGQVAARLMLHAAKLAFPHPDGGQTTVEAPLPSDMAGLATAAGLSEP